MSAIANIVAFDGAAVPVSHTFVPVNISRVGKRVIAAYREQLANVPVYAQPRLTVYLDDRTGSGVYRSGILVEIPVMETVTNANSAGYTAAPKVAHVVSERFEQTAHERSDITIRRLARQLLVNVAGNVSTTVAAATSGPASEIIDSLLAPT